jgi:hypothetical protein
MDRRTFLTTAAGAGAVAAAGGFATPAISQRAAARTLLFVPQADLAANFDPIWNSNYVVRNASAMVFDTLYGLDNKLVPDAKWSRPRRCRRTALLGPSACGRDSRSTTASRFAREMW